MSFKKGKERKEVLGRIYNKSIVKMLKQIRSKDE